jgi:hypothetical protein
MHAAHHYAAEMLLIPSGIGGAEQSVPPRSAAIKSARARGLADLIDNLVPRFQLRPSFYQPRGLRPNTRRQATCIRVAAQLLGGSPRDAACAETAHESASPASLDGMAA